MPVLKSFEFESKTNIELGTIKIVDRDKVKETMVADFRTEYMKDWKLDGYLAFGLKFGYAF